VGTKRTVRRQTYEVPWDDLTTDTDGLVSGESELVLACLDGLTVYLVRPSTVVSEDGSGFSDIETLGNGKSLSVVERLEGSEDIDISLHQGSDLHEVLASLETWNVESPGRVEGSVGGVKSDIDIGSKTLGDLDENLTSGRVVDTDTSVPVSKAIAGSLTRWSLRWSPWTLTIRC